MGDVILAASVLSCDLGAPIDWVVAKEFAPLLKGHPRIGRVWEFDRRASGFGAWVRFCRELKAQGYTDVLDLHASLRTRIAWVVFAFSGVSWRRVSKQRARLYGLYLFKKYWPRALRPTPFAERFAKLAGGKGDERADLTHLRRAGVVSAFEPTLASVQSYYCVMAGSRWEGKCWPAAHYLAVISELGRSRPDLGMPVLLGGMSDEICKQLAQRLADAGIGHLSGVGRWDLQQTAKVLGGARVYLGNDTGLAHLAEALKVPAYVVFGPTTPEMGFGPSRPESKVFEYSRLACRPCGKDGRRCYRLTRKYLCMTGLEPSQVIEQLSSKPSQSQEFTP